jgi:hypothetical protein
MDNGEAMPLGRLTSILWTLPVVVFDATQKVQKVAGFALRRYELEIGWNSSFQFLELLEWQFSFFFP